MLEVLKPFKLDDHDFYPLPLKVWHSLFGDSFIMEQPAQNTLDIVD